jgi:hypothetical protein
MKNHEQLRSQSFRSEKDMQASHVPETEIKTHAYPRHETHCFRDNARHRPPLLRDFEGMFSNDEARRQANDPKRERNEIQQIPWIASVE